MDHVLGASAASINAFSFELPKLFVFIGSFEMEAQADDTPPLPSIEALPDELLLFICSLLSPSEWCTLMITNKHLRDISDDNYLWAEIIPPDWKEEVQKVLVSSSSSTTENSSLVNQLKFWDRRLVPSNKWPPSMRFLQGGVTEQETFSWRKAFFSWGRSALSNFTRSQPNGDVLPGWISDKPLFGMNEELLKGSLSSGSHGYGIQSSTPFKSILRLVEVLLNIVLVGPVGCGKTSLTNKLSRTGEPFRADYRPTIGIEFLIVYAHLRK